MCYFVYHFGGIKKHLTNYPACVVFGMHLYFISESSHSVTFPNFTNNSFVAVGGRAPNITAVITNIKNDTYISSCTWKEKNILIFYSRSFNCTLFNTARFQISCNQSNSSTIVSTLTLKGFTYFSLKVELVCELLLNTTKSLLTEILIINVRGKWYSCMNLCKA